MNACGYVCESPALSQQFSPWASNSGTTDILTSQSLNASRNPLPVPKITTEIVPRHSQMSPGDKVTLGGEPLPRATRFTKALWISLLPTAVLFLGKSCALTLLSFLESWHPLVLFGSTFLMSSILLSFFLVIISENFVLLKVSFNIRNRIPKNYLFFF